MKTVNRLRAAAIVMLLACSSPTVFVQENSPVDLTGTWRWLPYEDERDRTPGAYPGDYRGLPLNDAARMRADTYDEEWNATSSLLQCRPRGPSYQAKGLDPMRIDQVVDPVSRQLVALRMVYEKTPGERMIWLDGRRRPSAYALHSWDGFSTGRFVGDTLEITTTHLKESYVRRNGVPASFRATVIEHISLQEPFLEWTFTVIDPDYLTEPLVRSATYVRAPTLQLPLYPCQPEEYQPGAKYRVPHYQGAENPYLTESAVKYRMPQEGTRGGADTTYPEWRAKGATLTPPTAQYRVQAGVQRRVDANRGPCGYRTRTAAGLRPRRYPPPVGQHLSHRRRRWKHHRVCRRRWRPHGRFGSNRCQRPGTGGCSRGGANAEAVGRT